MDKYVLVLQVSGIDGEKAAEELMDCLLTLCVGFEATGSVIKEDLANKEACDEG